MTAAAIAFKCPSGEVRGLVFFTGDDGQRLRSEINNLKGFRLKSCETANLVQLRDQLSAIIATIPESQKVGAA